VLFQAPGDGVRAADGDDPGAGVEVATFEGAPFLRAEAGLAREDDERRPRRTQLVGDQVDLLGVGECLDLGGAGRLRLHRGGRVAQHPLPGDGRVEHLTQRPQLAGLLRGWELADPLADLRAGVLEIARRPVAEHFGGGLIRSLPRLPWFAFGHSEVFAELRLRALCGGVDSEVAVDVLAEAQPSSERTTLTSWSSRRPAFLPTFVLTSTVASIRASCDPSRRITLDRG
jgi:hypothetical protein